MPLIMYGIPNCDTIKKAKKYLQLNNQDVEFHNYKTQGVPEALLQAWIAEFGWEIVLNKRGTTYRQLSDEQKQSLNADNALRLLIDNPSMIKRPILSNASQTLIGFNEALYHSFIN